MPHLRRLATPLLVVAGLLGASALAVAPASAQEPSIKVIVVENDMTNSEDREERWQMEVGVYPTGGCKPTRGDPGRTTSWLDAGNEVGFELSVRECDFRIDVRIRQANFRTDCWYTAKLSWDDGATSVEDYVFTADRPAGSSRLSVARQADSACASPPTTSFYITGSELVEDLPGRSANADLLALARQAAKVATFGIRIEPDTGAGAVPAICNRAATLTVRGDGERVGHPMQSRGQACPFRAVVLEAQPPFEAVDGRSVTFTDEYRIVDLTSLVRLPQARIAIIQDVRGTDNRGSASYTITRSCGDVSVTSPAATSARTPLHVGRFAVHTLSSPTVGAGAVYPAAAASADSDTIVGCSVTVSVRGLPADCAVAGGSTQRHTWTATDPLRNFDFEFDIDCGAGSTTQPAADAAPLDDDSAVDAVPDAAADATPVAPEGPAADMPTG